MINSLERSQIVTEQEVLLPVAQIINSTQYKTRQSLPSKVFPTPLRSIEDIFPEQKYEEKNIQLAKKTLGPLAAEFSLDELKVVITEVQFLTESWLDEFERQIFKGLTLQELLHEKGGK